MNVFAELIGESPGILAVRAKIRKLIDRQADERGLPPVLLQGETGTGKGLVAQLLHRLSSRSTAPFVDINCAAIPETLLEAELFGFERGAFTDARQAKPGLFQAASRGTIFLDEVGLLPERIQAKLLKVIEERSVRRLGSTRNEPADAWILAASNEDLTTAVRQPRFREDLYHRLAVLTIWLPPLRKRGTDILLLAEHLLTRTCTKHHLQPKTFAPDALDVLLAYQWPGNVRELANVIERVALFEDAPQITVGMLGLPKPSPMAFTRKDRTATFNEVSTLEQSHLLEVLYKTNWNVSRAAADLGVSRNTLRYRIEKYGLHPGTTLRSLEMTEQYVPQVTTLSEAVHGAVTPVLTGIRWEQRRFTLLRATLDKPSVDTSLWNASRIVEAIAEKIEMFGGRVEELSPAGVIAAFGLEPVEDAPRRAAYAAMAIQQLPDLVRNGEGTQRSVVVGIHVAQFVVGQIKGSLMIDLEAKREAWATLEALVTEAEPTTIWVSKSAAVFLDRHFKLVQIGTSGQAYQLVGREWTGLGQRLARFVGRDHELDILRNQVDSSRRGHAQATGIIGDPGIGKSRLLYEFRQSLSGESVTYLEGRCFSYGSASPYVPVLDIVRQYCGIAEGDPPQLIAEKVNRCLQEIGIAPEESAPYLLHLLGLKEGTRRLATMSPEAIKVETIKVFRQMSLNASRQRPIILVVEDLQWIDKTSEECLASLVEGLASASVLFVSTYRSGYRPPWIEKSYATQISLQPLSPEESLYLLESLSHTKDVAQTVAQLVVAKAEGNPFFLEELTRVVQEQGTSRPNLLIPDTIQEVLLARIERLHHDSKRLLQMASVLGREFSLGLFKRMWDGPGQIDDSLEELKRLEFLYEETGTNEPIYAFKHALTQEVAYQTLLPSHRQALHKVAGRVLETLYEGRFEEAYDRLAYHFSKTDEAEKAIEYLSRFAEKVARSYAHVEAVTALKEALVHAQKLRAAQQDCCILELVFRQVDSLHFLGRFSEILDVLHEQQERLARLNDPSLACRYYFLLGRSCGLVGDHEHAFQRLHQAIDQGLQCGDEVTMGKAYTALATECHLSGQFKKGVECGQRAIALLESTEERYWLGTGHWNIAVNAYYLGDFETASESAAQAFSIGKAIANPRLQSYAAWSMGFLQSFTSEWNSGIEACEQSVEFAQDPFTRAIALGFCGTAYLNGGVADKAITLLEQAIQQFGPAWIRQMQGWFTTILGEAYLLIGKIEKAHDLVLQGLQLAGKMQFRYGAGWALRALGRIAQTRGQLAQAETHFTSALETFTFVEARFEIARTQLALAELAHAQGNGKLGLTFLREAYLFFITSRFSNYVEQTAQLAARLGITLGSQGNGR